MIHDLTDLCSGLKSSNKLRDNSHPDSSEEAGGNEEQRRGERNKWKYCSTHDVFGLLNTNCAGYPALTEVEGFPIKASLNLKNNTAEG